MRLDRRRLSLLIATELELFGTITRERAEILSRALYDGRKIHGREILNTLRIQGVVIRGESGEYIRR